MSYSSTNFLAKREMRLLLSRRLLVLIYAHLSVQGSSLKLFIKWASFGVEKFWKIDFSNESSNNELAYLSSKKVKAPLQTSLNLRLTLSASALSFNCWTNNLTT